MGNTLAYFSSVYGELVGGRVTESNWDGCLCLLCLLVCAQLEGADMQVISIFALLISVSLQML